MEPGKLRIPQKKNVEQDGQSLAECTLILMFVALSCIAATTMFGGTVKGFFESFNGGF